MNPEILSPCNIHSGRFREPQSKDVENMAIVGVLFIDPSIAMKLKMGPPLLPNRQ